MLNRKILIVDDDKFLREMLVLIFEEEGYQIGAAGSGKEAWEMLNKNDYGLLMTDMYMPQMNGIELIKKCQESFPEMKTVIISGGGREVRAEHGKKYVRIKDQGVEVDVYLKKPCDMDEMFSVVKMLLGD